jgi:hypothetical protein
MKNYWLIDFSAYVNKSIIIKAVRKAGSYTCLCSGRTVFTTYARSIMYGEACSAVPLYKAKKDELNHRDMKSRYFHCFILAVLVEMLRKLKDTTKLWTKKEIFLYF